VATEDGWDYFVAGWSAALAAITGRDLTPERLGRAIESARWAQPRGAPAGRRQPGDLHEDEARRG